MCLYLPFPLVGGLGPGAKWRQTQERKTSQVTHFIFPSFCKYCHVIAMHAGSFPSSRRSTRPLAKIVTPNYYIFKQQWLLGLNTAPSHRLSEKFGVCWRHSRSTKLCLSTKRNTPNAQFKKKKEVRNQEFSFRLHSHLHTKVKWK